MNGSADPTKAGILNFFVPGAGLIYLGRVSSGLVNFVLVNGCLLGLAYGWADPLLNEHIHYVFLGLAALSAGYAHGVASSDRRQPVQHNHEPAA